MEFIEEFDLAIELWVGRDIAKISDALFTRPDEEVFEFAETMALISKHHFKTNKHNNENFSFIANSALSGGRYPCAFPPCRIERLKELTSFASLYADEVYVQNPFEEVMLRGAENVKQIDREELFFGIMSFYQVRPLIEKGIVKYAQNMVNLCESHKENLAIPLAQEIQRKEEKLYEIIHENLINNCSVMFDAKEGDPPFIEVSGPEDLIEHGKIFFHFFGTVPEYLRKLAGKKLPYSFSKQELIDEEILSLVISPILKDLSKQEWHSAFYGTSYLCDNPIKMRLASKLNSKAYAASSAAFEKGMRHYLPAVYGQDMRAIVDLREKEGEAFAVYRDKINTMIRGSGSWAEADVADIFRDQILPEINLIEKKVNDWKSNVRESLAEKVVFGTGVVTVGLYSGFLPPNIGQIVAAVGGGSALMGALIDYNKTLKEKQEARTNDFYFLWQAKKGK